MKHRFILIVTFCICLLKTVSASVDIRSSFFTINEGLADNLVRHIYQDSKGFIWMSTLNGLSRYDGYSFVTFRPEKGQHISLADRHVLEVSEDNNGFLWVKTSPELYSCYDLRRNYFVDFTGCGEYKDKYTGMLNTTNGDTWLWHNLYGCRKISYNKGEFSSVVFRKENGKLPENNVTQLLEDSLDNVWICTQSGIIKVYNDQTEILVRELHILSAFIHESHLIFLTAQGDVYRQSINGGEARFVMSLANAGQPFRTITNFRFRDKWIIVTKQNTQVFDLSTLEPVNDRSFDMPDAHRQWDNAGNLWLYNSYGQLRFFNSKNGNVRNFDFMLSNELIHVKWFNVIQDSRGLLWIATYDKGLYIYDPDTDEMARYTYQQAGYNQINSNNLVYIMEDRTGSIWVSSESSGVSHLSIVNGGESRIYPDNNQLINQSSSIRMLTQMNNGEIWMGNRKGYLYKYNAGLTKKTYSGKYCSTMVVRALQDASGKLWVGTGGDGLCIDGRWYVNEPDNSHSLSHNKISDIFCDHKDRMWVATFGGGLELAIPSDNGRYVFKHFLQDNFSQREVRIITSDKNNWMWVGTDDGVCVFHPDSLIQNPHHFYRYSYDNDFLPGNEVKSIFYDSKERIWLGTMGGGVSLCIPNGNYDNLQFVHYTTADGLINNMLLSIIEDKEGKLWMTTGYGMSRFTPETEHFENFIFGTSTPGNVYIEKSSLLLSDGRLLFGTDHGLLVIDPTKIKKQHNIPNVVLTDLKINGISTHPGDTDSPLQLAMSYTEAINLKHFQNSFIVEFSTLDYQTLNGTKFTYMLEGFDKEWNNVSLLNFAAYKNLSPGHYVLHVKACNAVGTWSDKETILQITIAPPSWKTIWAYILYCILIIAAAYVAYRTIYKFNTLRNRIHFEKQLTEYKLIFFTNISHEFRTPLTLIQGALEKIENVGKLPKELTYSIRIMERNTQRMLRLVNQLLEFRKMQNKKLSLSIQEVDVIAFLYDIYDSFSETATKKKIQFKFVSSVDSCRMYIDRGKLDKIVYNLLSNAFKYTPDEGRITMSVIVDKIQDKLVITVTDNGIGIPKEKQSQLFSRFMQSNFSNDSMGIGLHLTYELVNTHRGNITFHENEGGGSVFTVYLPLSSSGYTESDFLSSNPLTKETFMLKRFATDPLQEEEPHFITPLNKKKILIIEDNVDVREFLEREFSTYFEIYSASNGVSGLEQARTCDADLIVCDVLMPGLNGYEVTRRIKNDFETSHIPVVLLTAMDTAENQLEGVESGADAYITKPFSPKLLLARMFQLINQREILRKKFVSNPGIAQPVISSDTDKKFLEKLHTIIEINIGNPELNAEDFAAKMNLGRTSFFRKVRGVTGYSPNEYIRVIRIKKSAELLLDGRYNVSEVSYQVGFSHPFYFSRCFKEQFGVSPSMYIKSAGVINLDKDTEDME
ncbi:two-component regulator propeller domain-containing protein [Bacteroides sp. 51]|uniref:hybrid sensor histidine kinase/response regulator transcription factor n=1 Tax=Bacteroides sp. 51 TaxID=2302938 RepID=UPI0013D1BD19|nr:two-component regulator propeller domain-containing protein [Bacteroides sp. 51]NDV84387.1 hybrid sensor histidine kinase/response regulator [Bacteroides sp. 51]